MTDIVERLRNLAAIDNCQASKEAADEIELLRAALGRVDACIVCGQIDQARKGIRAALGVSDA